jgi:hypothetical protein
LRAGENKRRPPAAGVQRTPRDGGSTVLPREGAGLELDLTAPRHVDRLPSELRPDLPRRGFVNYLEAVAVVRKLEQLVRDPSVCSPGGNGKPGIAVLALYAGQVELIRRLIKRSALLSQASIPVVVDLPQSFRHRECPVVLVSLTRSHDHCAVSLGEDRGAVPIAFTRAQNRLIVFGDPGTLVRRSHWQGPLDHLDDAAAARERSMVHALLGYLQGQGKHAGAFHFVAEGGSA